MSIKDERIEPTEEEMTRVNKSIYEACIEINKIWERLGETFEDTPVLRRSAGQVYTEGVLYILLTAADNVKGREAFLEWVGALLTRVLASDNPLRLPQQTGSQEKGH